MPGRRSLPALAAALLAGSAPTAAAQHADQRPAPGTASDTTPGQRDTSAGPAGGAHAGGLAGAAATGGLILLGAAGAQTIRTPTAWPRTVGGFGRRVADQTGFYVVQTGTQRALARGLGLRDDASPCPLRGLLPLAGCAVVRTFTAVDRGGARRAHVPFLASVAAATAASVAWRPERRSAPKARAFAATRLGIVFAGYAGERLLLEWQRARGRAREP